LRDGRAVRAACAALLLAAPYAAHSDWAVGTDAGVRHDSNVGNAQFSTDIIADSSVDAGLSAYRVFPLEDGYGLTVGGDLRGEAYHELTGLNNVSADAALALKKKWGLGAFAPWLRLGATVARSSYRDSYRNSWDYRATLASGRRIDERWNLWGEYVFESRVASPQPELVPWLSGDAYSQVSHRVSIDTDYALTARAFLSLELSGRRGDVVSTSTPNATVFYASRALAEDPAFGPEAYAYRLLGTTWGARVGVSYSTTEHSLLGAAFERFDTHAEGGNRYAKSIVEVTWNYHF
jgi:hypothetical protein